MSWKDRLLDLLLPRICLGCREDLPAPFGGPLCGDCLRRLRQKPPAVQEKPASIDALRAAFSYKPPVPQMLHAFKYQGHLAVGRALGDWMAGAFLRFPELKDADAIVPVPLHPVRQRTRGFNQAAILAQSVARAAKLPVREILARVRNTRPQWRIAKERRISRLSTAFALSPQAAVAGKTFLLLDDVYTSGETLESCALALRKGRAVSVKAFVLSRAG